MRVNSYISTLALFSSSLMFCCLLFTDQLHFVNGRIQYFSRENIVSIPDFCYTGNDFSIIVKVKH